MPFKSLRSNSRDTNGPGYNSAQIGATLVALPTYFVAFIRRDYSFCGDFATVIPVASSQDRLRLAKNSPAMMNRPTRHHKSGS